MNKNKLILKGIINECNKHLLRMNSAYDKISPSLPFNNGKISSLSDDEIEHIDQFIYRFSKLQDAIGNKLFRSVLALLGEEVVNKAFIDIFSRLEQLNIIDNYNAWKELKDLRNELAHEYEEDPGETAEKLNLLFNKKNNLEKYLNHILTYIEKKDLLME